MDFTEEEIDIGYQMSEAATTAMKPFSFDSNPVYESMLVGQDQVRTIISSVSNTLDRQSFYNTLETQTAVSKFKMSIGAASVIEPKEIVDLWLNDDPWNVMIDISSLDQMVEDLDQEISFVATKAKGVTTERLSNIWSIDIETAKRTIDLTSQYVTHKGSSYLRRFIQQTIECCDISGFKLISLWIHFKLHVKLSLSAEINIYIIVCI